MAKKKRKKQTKKSFEYKYELIGLVFLVLSVLGIGKLGVAGELVASFSLNDNKRFVISRRKIIKAKARLRTLFEK